MTPNTYIATGKLEADGALLALADGFVFEDLYGREGLARLDDRFCVYLMQADADLHGRLLAARAAPHDLSQADESALILALAPYLEAFVARLFGVEAEVDALRAGHLELAPLYRVKRLFVQRRALKAIKPAEADAMDVAQLDAGLAQYVGAFDELRFAQSVEAWEKEDNRDALAWAERYAAWASLTDAGRARHADSILFRQPRKLDPLHLIHGLLTDNQGIVQHRLPDARLRSRDGFALTDPGATLAHALDEANYCIWCHHQGKDSCSKGLRDKPTGDAPASFKKSVLGATLTGCPLEEKISEMHEAKSNGLAIGALAIVTIDNPMAAATGHRICNDCMKSCIYQKQEPVNIPQAETRTLKDVLSLPWGFEIYALLTRWNPLCFARPLPRPDTGKKILVVGMGPAGFTLAHHLMNDGHTVVGVDGLKIEPLQAGLAARDGSGLPVPLSPIRDVTALYESLDDRIMAGFGGVAEYGITVRWDKNFLKVVRLLLERRREFLLLGGVRFGGALTVDSAFADGFDHIALCMGAGRPTIIDIPNGLARGVRAASDFLMALQLSGAAKEESIANLQLRMPVVVVGGGLTAIDTATEAMAYYPRQVEKFLARYEALVAARGQQAVEAAWTEEEAITAREFLDHAQAIRAERARAAREGRAPDFIPLMKSWGGVTVAYRKALTQSPSYTLNSEEVEKALEEGIAFAEGLDPQAVECDRFGHAQSVRFKNGAVLAARALLVAAGTQPNTVLAREDAAHFALDGRYFQAVDFSGQPVKPDYALSKPSAPHVLLARHNDGRGISFFGDLHPSYFGNVVKAMGSAKQGYPIVTRLLAERPASAWDREAFFDRMDRYRARVHAVNRLTPTIIEVVLHAPAAAQAFEPGQFYRLQNFESLAPVLNGTRMAMEGLAMTGAWVDKDQGLVAVIALEMGGSSDLCAFLRPDDPVVLMGPTGAPTHIQGGETVLLVGGGLGNAVLFSIGQAFRAAGSRVLYVAGYKKRQDRYKVAQIEAAADAIVWACDEAPGFVPKRPQDKAFVGNIIEAIAAYGRGDLGDAPIALGAVDRIIAIGSDRMMAAVTAARHGVLQPMLKPHHFAIGSINSPMQCMMKEICAQCLQPHVDPVTGERSYVFSCFNQDQPLDQVDWRALNARLGQNSLQEKLTAQWIDHCLRQASWRASAAQ